MASQTLSLSQTQQQKMIMAPQMRQSLEILQLQALDLRQLVSREIEQNPTLEDVPQTELSLDAAAEKPDATPEDPAQEMDFDKEYEALAKLDDEWRDYFYQNSQEPPSGDREKNRQFFFDSIERKESLQAHLLEQLTLTDLPPEDVGVARLLIGSIGDDGYLTTPPEELALSAGCDADHLLDVLSVIQDFHPAGVGARDVRECLLLQLEGLGHHKSLAADIVRDHLDRLAARKFQDIARLLKVDVGNIRKACDLISTLEPKPGRIYSSDEATYVLPEIAVRKTDGEYTVALNDEHIPHLRISRHYRQLMEDKSTSPEVRAYIQERIRSSVFLIRSIEQRQRTLHRIAAEIVKAQSEFLDRGIAHMKPMTMSDVARKVGVHETTVSRAVSGKYMKTPSGVFDLKYFFTAGIKTESGQDVSNASVKDMIATMVANENPSRPLSDQEIMEKLAEQGIRVARRTIAKYRLALRVPPSHLRKSL
jgi:RNA polymerase sigma-54 factor